MNPIRFGILLALADEVLHGSAIAKKCERLTQGQTRLWPVTLYKSLDDMATDRLIREVPTPSGPRGRHRWFQITDAGQDALADEARRLRGVADMALKHLGDHVGDVRP